MLVLGNHILLVIQLHMMIYSVCQEKVRQIERLSVYLRVFFVAQIIVASGPLSLSWTLLGCATVGSKGYWVEHAFVQHKQRKCTII